MVIELAVDVGDDELSVGEPTEPGERAMSAAARARRPQPLGKEIADETRDALAVPGRLRAHPLMEIALDDDRHDPVAGRHCMVHNLSTPTSQAAARYPTLVSRMRCLRTAHTHPTSAHELPRPRPIATGGRPRPEVAGPRFHVRVAPGIPLAGSDDDGVSKTR